MSEISVFQMIPNTEIMVEPQVSQNAFSALNMDLAAVDRAFQRATHRALIASQIFRKDSLTASPFSAHHSDRAPNMVIAAFRMSSQAFSRKSLMAPHALRIACLALSAPIPALSNRDPMRLLSPRIKAKKSSTRSARTTMTATIARIFSFIPAMARSIFLSPSRKASSLGRAMTPKAAPAIRPISLNSFSVPPSFSASHSIRVCSFRRTSMPVLNALTIVVPRA